jgi:hypothetical protein
MLLRSSDIKTDENWELSMLALVVLLRNVMDLPLVTIQPRPTYLTLSSRLFLHLKI